MATSIYLKNQWVWAVCGLGGGIKTFLNRLATNVAVTYTLNAPAVWTADVPSDNPEIDIPVEGGSSGFGDPFVSYNDRLLYGFRREAPSGSGEAPYVCRFAGVLMTIQDEATTEDPVSHLTAYDPWMWLNSIPVVDEAGDLLSSTGLVYTGKTGNFIAKDLISNALAAVLHLNPSNPSFIDYTSGTFETTEELDITFAQNISVGEAWTQLVDTGTLDIVLDPVYEPLTLPGVLAQMNVYNQAGGPKDNAVFAWDKFPRNLVGISRLLDGTQMENVGQYYTGGTAVTQESDDDSIDQYGQYWVQKSFPSPANSAAVSLVALADVALRRKGKQTLTVDPAPPDAINKGQPAPDPFTEYFLGDQVPVWAGRPIDGGGYSLRELLSPGDVTSGGQWSNPMRVYAIPITLDDDQVETVTQLLLTDPNA